MKLSQQVSLAALTSYTIGGNADYYALPTSIAEVQEVLSMVQEGNLPLFILGKGSNILVSDQGFKGVVLDTSSLTTLAFSDTSVTVGAGVLLTKLVTQSVNKGLAGLEELAGIPGSVGGGVLMNAGAYGREIAEHLSTVTWIDLKTNTLKTSTINELTFGYRTSSFRKSEALILEATWTLLPGKKEELIATVRSIQEKRKEKQPLKYPSCGSVFKRPPGNYAGALIEQAGLKGHTIGGAQISELHANFFINRGGATAQDVLNLISFATQEVFHNSGIHLESEVILVGDFTTPLWTPSKQTGK